MHRSIWRADTVTAAQPVQLNFYLGLFSVLQLTVWLSFKNPLTAIWYRLPVSKMVKLTELYVYATIDEHILDREAPPKVLQN